jgi:hypothetical protein
MSQRVILLGGVAAVFLLMVSAQANASCKACNLAHRDCRTAAQMAYKLCKADCRLDFAGDRDGRRACFETCQIPRSDTRGACDADRATCNDTCSNAASPA